MEPPLTPVEARVLGVLIEKQMATPEYYPLTLNALVAACNQKTNRTPVMELDEAAVSGALHSLRQRRVVWQVKTQGSRALKYEHNMGAVADFSDRELGVVCELLLRGPQTVGELRSRTARLVEFHGLGAVEHTLKQLANAEKGPFVVELPRQPGQKEPRFTHLFGGDDPMAWPLPHEDRAATAAEEDRVTRLEARVTAAEAALADLEKAFSEFRKRFE